MSFLTLYNVKHHTHTHRRTHTHTHTHIYIYCFNLVTSTVHVDLFRELFVHLNSIVDEMHTGRFRAEADALSANVTHEGIT